jgi:hypothetical protein
MPMRMIFPVGMRRSKCSKRSNPVECLQLILRRVDF